MRTEILERLAVLGLLSAAWLPAQDAPLASGSVNVNLAKDSPVALINLSTGDSRGTSRGAALVLDLHMSLQFRNISSNRIHGVTLRVVSQEVTLGGKSSVAYPSLNIGPGEVFPARIDMQLIRPTQIAGGPLVEVNLDGVLFQDLTFYGPDRLNSRRTMTAWEMEAQRDREYFRRILARGGKPGLQEEMLHSLARQSALPQLDVRVRPGGGRAVTSAAVPQEHAQEFAFVKFPDSPVEPLAGWAQVAGNEARAPSIEVRNRSSKQVRYVELGWVLTDQTGRPYMAGSLPSAGPTFYLPPGRQARVLQESTLSFSSRGQPIGVQRMTSFVNQVEFADGTVWVPNRQDLEDSTLQKVLAPSAEEQRLSNLYVKKGIDAVIEELKKY